MEALLQLKGIDKAFPGVKALSGAALNVYPGRVMALVGENGAGKSTMMKVSILAMPVRFYGWGKKRRLPGRNLPRKPGLGLSIRN